MRETALGFNRLPEVRERHAAAVAEVAADSAEGLGLVYTPLALADIPALTNEIGELRRLYLTARGALRELVGAEGVAELGLGGTNPAGLPPVE
ncbi:hypothetical protein R8Z50_22820 [Longispora sp. K20-0274]|uniref:hypothetical protein n=1 Tax=Longispora sp. K20-0274 TaxID=3088255 RepID=UPI00399BFE5D